MAAPALEERAASVAWGASSAPSRPSPSTVGVLALLAVAALVVVAGVTFSWVAALALVVLLALACVGWLRVQSKRALAAVDARPLTAGDAPRLPNLVHGVATLLQRSPPKLYVSERATVNALVSVAEGGALVMTRGALEQLTRTELEAVVAHCLVRLTDGGAGRTALATAFGPLAARTTFVGGDDDLRTCALTRYPPALITALRKADPERGGLAPLWFVADHPTHRTVEERVAALSDL